MKRGKRNKWKNNITDKQVFDVILATLFVAWLFFEIIIQGNAFDIFRYSGFSGKLIVLMGHISPAIAVYMFMGVWGQAEDAKAFLRHILKCYSWFRTAIVLFAFIGVHYIFVNISTVEIVRPKGFAFIAVPFCFLTCGVAEISFRGIIFRGLCGKIPFFLACVLTGTLMLVYNIPLCAVDGTRQAVTDLALFYIYCVYLSILQGCIYRLTLSVFACMIFATYMMTFSYLYEGLLFERPAIALFAIVEVVAALVVTYFKSADIPINGGTDANNISDENAGVISDENAKSDELRKADNKEADNKEADNKEADNKEADNKEADNKEADNKEADNKEADNKEADNKEADRKEAEE